MAGQGYLIPTNNVFAFSEYDGAKICGRLCVYLCRKRWMRYAMNRSIRHTDNPVSHLQCHTVVFCPVLDMEYQEGCDAK